MLTPFEFTYCLFFLLRNNLKKLLTREYFPFNIVSNLLYSKFSLNYLGDFKMNKLLISAILTMGIALASAPVMARQGADDPAGHDAAEHSGGGGHDATEHGGGHDATEHGGGHDATEHGGGHDANEHANEHATNHEANEAEHEANEAEEHEAEVHAAGHEINDDVLPAPVDVTPAPAI